MDATWQDVSVKAVNAEERQNGLPAVQVSGNICTVRMHVMQRTVLLRDSVRPSVCPSVERVICDNMKETCAHILIPHERTFILVF